MTISIQRFRSILDEMEISHVFHKESGVIEFLIHETDPVTAVFKILICVSEEREMIQATGILCEKDLDGSDDFQAAYRFCNQWHADTIMPKAVVNTEGKFLACEWSWDSDVGFDDDALKGLIVNFIQGTELCINRAAEAGLYHFEKQADERPKGLLEKVAALLPGRK